MADKKQEKEDAKARKKENKESRKAAKAERSEDNEKGSSPPLVDGEEYIPYEHREMAKGTNYFETLCNMLKASVGTGLLLLPDAFRNSGYVIGIIGTIVAGLICAYSVHVLVKCQFMASQKMQVPKMLYPQTMKTAFESGPNCFKKMANCAPVFVNSFILFQQIGVCCIYALFVAEISKQVCDHYWKVFPIELHLAFLLLPFILLNLLPNMRLLAYVSIFGIIVTLASIGIILYFVLQDLPPLTDREMIKDINGIALFIGTVLFSWCGPGVIIAIEAEMKKPMKYVSTLGVLNVSMLILIFIYAPFGLIGYWKYGEQINSAIILFLPKDALGMTTKILYGVNILLSFPINCYVSVRIIWDDYILKHLEGKKHIYLYEVSLRILLVIFSVGLAAAVPLLSLIISLVGVVSMCSLAFIFPALMDICLRYPAKYGKGKGRILQDVLLIFVGVVGFLIGTIGTVEAIVKTLIKLRADNTTK